MNTTTIPDDLIGLAEASRLLPSRKAGKKLHVATLYRWIEDGRLAGWRIGGHWFCSRADVLAIPKRKAVSAAIASRQDRGREIAEAQRVLKEAGFR